MLIWTSISRFFPNFNAFLVCNFQMQPQKLFKQSTTYHRLVCRPIAYRHYQNMHKVEYKQTLPNMMLLLVILVVKSERIYNYVNVPNNTSHYKYLL